MAITFSSGKRQAGKQQDRQNAQSNRQNFNIHWYINVAINDQETTIQHTSAKRQETKQFWTEYRSPGQRGLAVQGHDVPPALTAHPTSRPRPQSRPLPVRQPCSASASGEAAHHHDESRHQCRRFQALHAPMISVGPSACPREAASACCPPLTVGCHLDHDAQRDGPRLEPMSLGQCSEAPRP